MASFESLPNELVYEISPYLSNPDLFKFASTRLYVAQICQKHLQRHKRLRVYAKHATSGAHRGNWLSPLTSLLMNPGIQHYFHSLWPKPYERRNDEHRNIICPTRPSAIDVKMIRRACEAASPNMNNDVFLRTIKCLVHGPGSIDLWMTNMQLDWHLLPLILPQLHSLHTLTLHRPKLGSKTPNAEHLINFLNSFAEACATPRPSLLPCLKTLDLSGKWSPALLVGFLCLPSVKRVRVEILDDKLDWPANERRSNVEDVKIINPLISEADVVFCNQALFSNIVGPCTISACLLRQPTQCPFLAPGQCHKLWAAVVRHAVLLRLWFLIRHRRKPLLSNLRTLDLRCFDREVPEFDVIKVLNNIAIKTKFDPSIYPFPDLKSVTLVSPTTYTIRAFMQLRSVRMIHIKCEIEYVASQEPEWPSDLPETKTKYIRLDTIYTTEAEAVECNEHIAAVSSRRCLITHQWQWAEDTERPELKKGYHMTTKTRVPDRRPTEVKTPINTTTEILHAEVRQLSDGYIIGDNASWKWRRQASADALTDPSKHGLV